MYVTYNVYGLAIRIEDVADQGHGFDAAHDFFYGVMRDFFLRVHGKKQIENFINDERMIRGNVIATYDFAG